MDVIINTTIKVSVAKLVETMSNEQLVLLLTECSHRFYAMAKERNKLAIAFSEGLSENGCRFLAEVVTNHYFRN